MLGVYRQWYNLALKEHKSEYLTVVVIHLPIIKTRLNRKLLFSIIH